MTKNEPMKQYYRSVFRDGLILGAIIGCFGGLMIDAALDWLDTPEPAPQVIRKANCIIHQTNTYDAIIYSGNLVNGNIEVND
jgi:hypothetical protein